MPLLIWKKVAILNQKDFDVDHFAEEKFHQCMEPLNNNCENILLLQLNSLSSNGLRPSVKNALEFPDTHSHTSRKPLQTSLSEMTMPHV